MRIDSLGDSALVVRLPVAPDEVEPVLDALSKLREAKLGGVIEVAPAYNTLGVFYDPSQVAFDVLAAQIAETLARAHPSGPASPPRTIEIPVCYDAEFGPDLDEVARHTGLTSDQVIARHSGADYVVSCVGFTPGFPYLSGIPNELSTPRRATPRKQVPPGSVAIGGSQTGVYPTTSPGGWNLIGRTPLRLFDVMQTRPALLQAGDRVRFRVITREEFER